MPLHNLLSSAASGIKVYSDAISVISQNVSNVRTDGYKKTQNQYNSNFARSFNSLENRLPYGGSGVKAHQMNRIDNEGLASRTHRDLDLAVTGNGFFATVTDPNNFNTLELTDAGSFAPHVRLDNGQEIANLIDLKGNVLLGAPINIVTRAEVNTVNDINQLQAIDVTNTRHVLPSTATTTVDFSIKLDNNAATGQTFNSPIQIYTGRQGADEERLGMVFTRTSTSYDNNEIAWELSLSPQTAAISNIEIIEPAVDANTYINDNNVKISFNQLGVLQAPKTIRLTFDYPAVGDIAARQQTFDIRLTADLFTSNSYVENLTTDGHARGNLANYRFTDRGTLEGTFDNGERRDLYRIPLARVPATNQLLVTNGTHFKVTNNSGAVSFTLIKSENNNTHQVTFTAGAVEQANADLAGEFVDLVNVQRSMQFNSRVLTTVNELMQTATNIKR